MPIVKVNGIEINFETHGSGPETLILLNGVAMTAASWGLQIPSFAKEFRVLAFDFRGQGKSSQPEADYYPIKTQSEDLFGLMKALHIERAHLLGLSYGGLIAQQFAIDHPEMVDKLILSNTAVYADSISHAILNSWEAAGVAGGGALRFSVSLPLTFSARYIEKNPAMIAYFAKAAEQSEWKPFSRLARGAVEFDVRKELPSIKAKTLVLTADEDRFIIPQHSKLIADLIPGAKFEVLRQCGHAAPFEAPEAYNQIVLNFLRNHST